MTTRSSASSRALRLAALCLVSALAPAAAARPPAPTSFRAGPAHPGAYDSRPVRRQPALRWRFETRGPVHSSPTLAGSLVLFGSGDGALYALDAAGGREAWRFATGGAVDSSPAVAGDAVFFTSRDRNVYAVDLATGARRWSVATGADLPHAWGYDYFLSSPAVSGGDVVVGAGDGVVYCLSAATGDVRWRFRTEGRVRSSPAVSDGAVFVGSMDGRLYALDAATGRLLWKFDTEGVSIDLAKEGYDRRSIVSSPAVASGVVTFGSRDAFQYALDAKTGRLLWKVRHPVGWIPGSPEVSWVDGSPAVSRDVAYVGVSDGYFVDAKDLRTGRELWRFATPDRANASVTLAGGTLVAGCDDGNVYGLDAATGSELWRFPTRDAVESSPAVAGGVVYFGSNDGALYAISDEDAAGRVAPARAVYYEEKANGGWFLGSRRVRDGLAAAGFAVLDAKSLAPFLEARAADRAPSVVVFASDAPPADAVDAPAGSAPLVRRYVESGGRVVWVGCPPLAVKYDPAAGKVARAGPDAARAVLGAVAGDLDGANGEEVRSVATPDGLAWGLPSWETASLPVGAGDVTTVLARDDAGRATAWVKSVGAGAFVRLWGRARPIPDVGVVRRVAEHGLVAPAPAEDERDLSASFDVQRLADGVYAVVRKEPPGFAVDANNVFVVDDDGVVVVDSNGSRSSTRAVLAALRKITDKPVRYVVNTHWHDDHILGNQVYRDAFPGVEFVAHAATREYLPGKGLAARKQAFAGVPQFLAFLRDLVEKGKTESGRELTDEERTAFRSDLEIGGRYLAEGPSAEIVLPTITVEDRLTLYRGKHVVDIRYLGRGHTSGDLVVHLPNEGILVTGDLVVWPIPLVGSDQSHVGDWGATIEKLLALRATVFVPGHGPVMRDDSYPRLMADLFASVKRQTEAAVARGASLEEARKAVSFDELRPKFAGDSKLRNFVFDNYVVRPSVESAWRDATEGNRPQRAQ